jgi:hypothetical protein
MARFLVGLLCGAALCAGVVLVGGVSWLRSSSGCWGRCGDGTRCVDHHCLAAAPSHAPAAPVHAGRHHHRHSGDSPSAPPEITLHPGDEKMVAQGDSLGRAEHVDLTAAGDDGKELEQEDLDRVFHPSQPSIERCITDALGDIPLETGRVEVAFRVERSGQVSRARVTAPAILQRQGLTHCVRAVVDGLRFPASGGASVVTYPFELK